MMNPNISATELVDASWLRFGVTSDMNNLLRDEQRKKAETIVSKVAAVKWDDSAAAVRTLSEAAGALHFFLVNNESLYPTLVELCAAKLRASYSQRGDAKPEEGPDPVQTLGFIARAASDLSRAWSLTF